MNPMNSESRLHTVSDVIDAHSRRLISSREAWRLISFLVLDEIAPLEAESDLSQQLELITDLREDNWRRSEEDEQDSALAARIIDLKRYLARNF